MGKNTENLKSFLKELEQETEQVITKINNGVKGAAESVHTSLFLPKALGGVNKQTGHLRANYIVTVDQEFTGVVGSRNNVDTSKRDANWEAFLSMNDLHEVSSILFNNNVHYGVYVNYEQGQQFKAKAIQAGKEYIPKS